MKDIYIVGAGGFGREVVWLIERINRKKNEWNIKGFLDDNSALWASTIEGVRVVGGCDVLEKINTDAWVICAVGSAKVRRQLVDKIRQNTSLPFATLVDPDALVGDRVKIGAGSILCAGSIITVDVILGEHAIINLDTTIGHDVRIGDFVSVCPSVNISGGTVIKDGCEIGTGACTIPGVYIGRDCVIGAGTVVIDNIPEESVAVGNPARIL